MEYPTLHSRAIKIVTELGSDPSVCVVRIHGDIDIATTPDVRDAVESAVHRGCTNVVLDLAHVSYADSAAMGLIVWIDRLLEPRSGRVVLAGASRNVARVLELSGLIGTAPTLSAAECAADAVAGLSLAQRSEEPLWSKSLSRPASTDSLAQLRTEVCDMVEPLGMSDATMFDVRVAVGEALANAIRHGSPGGEADEVTVLIDAYSDRVVLTVTDRGGGFDGAAACESDLYASSGRGVMFMRALMDDVQFTCLTEGGTAVRLTKHVGSGGA